MAEGREKSALPEGAQFNAEALQLNDEVVDMLMLLDYEQRFCNSELKPMSRTFFVYPAQATASVNTAMQNSAAQAINAAQQFKYFSCLVDWSLGLMNVKAEWDEYEDPNTVVMRMLQCLKDSGIQVNAVPGKLKQGFGDSVCLVLHSLLREVLRRVEFEWGVPSYPDEGLADEAEVDSDAEIQSVDEDEMPDGEEDDLMYQEDDVKKAESDDDHQVLEATVDPRDWLLEVERVAPKLKIQMPNDSKEWRTHLQQTRGYKQVIETQFPGAKAQLQKLSSNLSNALERIRMKEASVNDRFGQRTAAYRTQQEELAQVKSQYTELNEVVMNLQTELRSVTEELESVKTEMEAQSSKVTDTAPIVQMKDAFKRLRADTRQLEVRIGVVSHTLMQAKLRQRPQEDRHKQGIYNGGNKNNDSDGYDDADS